MVAFDDPTRRTSTSEVGFAALGAAEYDCDLRTGEIVHSTRLSAMLGLPEDQVVTLAETRERYHPDDAERVVSVVRRAEADGELQFVREFRLVLPDGRERWVRSGGEVVLDDDGSAVRVRGVMVDITDAKLREAHQSFLLALSDALRPLGDSWEIKDAAARLIGRRLHVNRALYAEIVDEAEVTVRRDYVDGLPSIEGRQRLSVYGEMVTGLLRGGGCVVIDDVDEDPRLDEVARAAFRASGVAAAVAVGLVKDGRWVGAFGVHSAAPRDWSRHEIALVEDTAERTWAAVERAHAERALRETHQQLSMALDAARMATWFWDPALDRVVTSPTMADIVGQPPEGTWETSEQGLALLHPDDRERHRELVERARAGGVGWHSEFRIVRPVDGAVAWLEEHATAEPDPQTGRLRIAGVVWDVTERKRTEANLAFLADVGDMLSPPADVDEALAELMERIARHFGVTRCSLAEIDDEAGEAEVTHEWHAAEVPAIVGATYRVGEYVDDAFSAAARKGQVVVVEDTVTDERTSADAYDAFGTRAFVTATSARDGRWRYVLSISDARPRAWRDDEVSLLRELTGRVWLRLERARAAAAARADRELRDELEREFVANAAHELRTPLTSIIASVEALEAGALDVPEQRERFFGHVKREADRMARLCESLLLLAHVDANAAMRTEPVVLRALLDDVGRDLHAAPGVEVVVRAEPELVIVTSRGLLELVVATLADNAVKSTTDGTIALVAATGDGAVVVEVADTGAGISDDVAARAFERFYRGGPRTAEGFGLGLSIAHRAATALGARLELEPRPEGGTVGRLTLPLE